VIAALHVAAAPPEWDDARVVFWLFVALAAVCLAVAPAERDQQRHRGGGRGDGVGGEQRPDPRHGRRREQRC